MKVLICDTSGRASKPPKPRPLIFHHEPGCPCVGFIALKSARALKKMGYCGCVLPEEDS